MDTYEAPKMPTRSGKQAGYSIAYCLANIGELRPAEALARWIDRRAAPNEPRDIDIWLIDQYFKQAGASDAAAAARHAELTAGLDIDGRSIKQSRWNAAWSVNDMLVVAKDVDVSDIPTIEVLDFPPGLQLTDMQRCLIGRNFLEHAGYLEGSLGRWVPPEPTQAEREAGANESGQ